MNLETPILDLAELTGRTRRRSTLPPAAPSVSPAVVRALERIESEVWKDLYSAAPEAIRAAAGVGRSRHLPRCSSMRLW